jgi:hypothetical protein
VLIYIDGICHWDTCTWKGIRRGTHGVCTPGRHLQLHCTAQIPPRKGIVWVSRRDPDASALNLFCTSYFIYCLDPVKIIVWTLSWILSIYCLDTVFSFLSEAHFYCSGAIVERVW